MNVLSTQWCRKYGGQGQPWSTLEALRYGTCSQGISQFHLHTHMFSRNRNETYLPMPCQL